MKGSTSTTKIIVVLSTLLLLLVWQLGAVLLDAEIILPRVGPTLAKFVQLVKQPPFSLNLLPPGRPEELPNVFVVGVFWVFWSATVRKLGPSSPLSPPL